MSNEEMGLVSLEYVAEGLPQPVDVYAEMASRGLIVDGIPPDPYTSEAVINPEDYQMEV